jgi:hypothetical protein
MGAATAGERGTRMHSISTHDDFRNSDPAAADVIAEQAAIAARERRKLSDLAFVFLDATGGDTDAAVKLLDDFVDLVVEGGVLQTWRYRELLTAVRGGCECGTTRNKRVAHPPRKKNYSIRAKILFTRAATRVSINRK